MSIAADRAKGAALACKFGAPKTAEIITTACYQQIFQSAIEEIGTTKLVDALAEAKNAQWAFHALRHIPDLTEAQRTKLCDVIVAAKDAERAFYALRDIPDLTEAQRAALFDVIVESKNAGWAYRALLHIHGLTDAQRSVLKKIARPT